MELLMDSSIWVGLVTLIFLEIILGLDNLVFIAILADKLPIKQRNRAWLIGLSLAMIIRLLLLSVISWMTTLTRPIISIFRHVFSIRDLVTLLGGFFLFFKAIIELYKRINIHLHKEKNNKNYTDFWFIILQIVLIDATFSLDTVITSVGIVNYLPIMMVAVIIAMTIMLLASKPLTKFVNQHPTIIIFCLSLLLIIGLGMLIKGFSPYVPQDYILFSVITFSALMEMFDKNLVDNQYFINKSNI